MATEAPPSETQSTDTGTTTPSSQPQQSGSLFKTSTTPAETAQPDQTTQPEQTQTDQAPKVYTRPEKYKTDADAYKALSDQESYIGKLNTELKTLKDSHATPEAYNTDAVFKETGLAWVDEDQQTAVTKTLKDAGFSQKQAEIGMKMYAEQLNRVVSQYGAPVDVPAEGTKLKEMWGQDYEKNLDMTSAMQSKLPPSLARAVGQHALGMEMLRQWTLNQRGPNPIRETEVGDSQATQDKLKTITSDPLYYSQGAKGESLRREAAKLSKSITGR